MSLLNGLLGALSGQQGAAGQGVNPLIQVALSLLAGGGQGQSQAGGLGGLLGSLAGGNGAAGGLGGLLGSLAGGGGAAGGAGGLGGLGGLIEAFQRNGMGDQVQSWVGTGQNLPISGDQLQQVLGNDLLAGIARQLGQSPAEASSGLAGVLPDLIDKLTPQGQLPQGGMPDVASIMAMLGGRR